MTQTINLRTMADVTIDSRTYRPYHLLRCGDRVVVRVSDSVVAEAGVTEFVGGGFLAGGWFRSRRDFAAANYLVEVAA
jgi:hypothetical protein